VQGPGGAVLAKILRAAQQLASEGGLRERIWREQRQWVRQAQRRRQGGVPLAQQFERLVDVGRGLVGRSAGAVAAVHDVVGYLAQLDMRAQSSRRGQPTVIISFAQCLQTSDSGNLRALARQRQCNGVVRDRGRSAHNATQPPTLSAKLTNQ